MLIDTLDSYLRPLPFRIQTAIDNQWEKAWRIEIEDFAYSAEEIRDFLGKSDPIVGIELFYKTLEGTDCYFGLQHDRSLKKVSSTFEFMSSYFQLVDTLKDLSLANVVLRLAEVLNGAPLPLLSNEVYSVDIGIVNWWLSFDVFELWNKTQPKTLNLQRLMKGLSAYKHLLSNEMNYSGLEFFYTNPLQHWICFQVGEQVGNSYKFNPSRTLSLLAKHLNFNIR